ncbi:MAG: hypothetical protein HZC01_01820 [Candidatus Kerfeldbacteria bacterium]|nr:hypothetical protein [Candidatus Kerfeldbacteria bacterium]
MQSKIGAYLGLSILLMSLCNPVFAQSEEITPIEQTPLTAESVIAGTLTPRIITEDFIEFGKKTLFDATDSILNPDAGVATYRWDFSDSTIAQFGPEILYQFSGTGIHRVALTITQADQSVTIEKEVFVYDTRMLMIADREIVQNLDAIVKQAANNGVLLKVLSSTEAETGFLTEEKLIPLIAQEADFITTADVLIFYTNGSVGLQSFTRYWQNLVPEKKINLESKLVVSITDQNMAIAAELTQQSFRVIAPRFILLTRKESLNPIFETDEDAELVPNLESRAIEYRIVDSRSEKSNFFFLSHAISTFIAKGIPTNTIYLILAVPFIAFIITFARQVIGITAFGLYTPLVIALALLILGLWVGLGTVLVVVAISYLLRLALSRFRLLYIPKTSLILSAIGLSFLAVIWIVSLYELSLAATLAIFPMLVMSTISEKFLSAQSEEGLGSALSGVVTTIVVSTVAYYVVVWDTFTNLIMSWPELILVPLLGTIILGKFTGLRWTEYVRFRSLLKEKTIEEE